MPRVRTFPARPGSTWSRPTQRFPLFLPSDISRSSSEPVLKVLQYDLLVSESSWSNSVQSASAKPLTALQQACRARGRACMRPVAAATAGGSVPPVCTAWTVVPSLSHSARPLSSGENRGGRVPRLQGCSMPSLASASGQPGCRPDRRHHPGAPRVQMHSLHCVLLVHEAGSLQQGCPGLRAFCSHHPQPIPPINRTVSSVPAACRPSRCTLPSLLSCSSANSSSEWKEWWPAGIQTPTVYFHLRFKQLKYLQSHPQRCGGVDGEGGNSAGTSCSC